MLVQDRCKVCAIQTIGSEIILDAPMVLLRDEAHVEAHFGAFGDSVNLDARYKSFWTHPMELLGDVGLVESRIGPFGDNVSVSSDRGTVCAKMYDWLRNCFGHTQWYS